MAGPTLIVFQFKILLQNFFSTAIFGFPAGYPVSGKRYLAQPYQLVKCTEIFKSKVTLEGYKKKDIYLHLPVTLRLNNWYALLINYKI